MTDLAPPGLALVILYLLIKELLVPMWRKLSSMINSKKKKFIECEPKDKNPGANEPGYSKICLEQAKALSKLEGEFNAFLKTNDRDQVNNRQDHQRIFKMLDNLK